MTKKQVVEKELSIYNGGEPIPFKRDEEEEAIWGYFKQPQVWLFVYTLEQKSNVIKFRKIFESYESAKKYFVEYVKDIKTRKWDAVEEEEKHAAARVILFFFFYFYGLQGSARLWCA